MGKQTMRELFKDCPLLGTLENGDEIRLTKGGVSVVNDHSIATLAAHLFPDTDEDGYVPPGFMVTDAVVEKLVPYLKAGWEKFCESTPKGKA